MRDERDEQGEERATRERVRVRFEALTLALQRAVGEADSAATYYHNPRAMADEWEGALYAVEPEVWEEMTAAYKAIGDYALAVAYGKEDA